MTPTTKLKSAEEWLNAWDKRSTTQKDWREHMAIIKQIQHNAMLHAAEIVNSYLNTQEIQEAHNEIIHAAEQLTKES